MSSKEVGREPPRKIVLGDGEVTFKCNGCEWECDESGECFEGEQPCYYCPPEACENCGRGWCDNSC
jgi:hypothetical protein